jgi:transcriptional regulator with XRE-family HTH domain
MNSVERVKLICKERKIPVSKLEKDLGYSNGYIGQLRKGVFPADRLSQIAAYLNVSTDYIMTGQETPGYYINEETAAIAQEIFENKELRVLFDTARDAAPEDLETVHSMLLALKRKEQGNID